MKKSKKKQERRKFLFLISRYLLVFVFGVFISIFYLIFTPLTLLFLKLIFNLFFEVKVVKNFLIFNSTLIEIIPACVGGSAYYLLLALNFLTPNIKIKKRLGILLISFFSFFVFNLLRLFFLILLEFKGIETNFYHKFFWYFGSTLFVFALWILLVKLFKIKEIPVISDFTWLFSLAKKGS